MSLISTLQRTDSVQESEQQQPVTKRVPSVYQQDGKPLSKEALYRYKLKYNNFQIQNANSEDQEQELQAKRIKNGNIAAKLAVQNTASEKENLSEIAAKRNSPEEHYKRLLVHPNASQIAATRSHSLVSKKSASPKAKSATNNTSLFSHDSLVNAANKAATKSQYQVGRNGSLQTSAISSKKMDLSKLKTVASEEDVENSVVENKKFNLSKLMPQAIKNAENFESKRKVSNIPIPIQGLKTKHEFDPLVQSKYEIDSLTVLASKLADERVLDSVNTIKKGKNDEKALFTNEEWNKIAVELVMKNKEQILSDLKDKQSSYESQAAPESVKTGKNGRIYKLGDIGAKNKPEAVISLGNGLTLTQGEVTKLASKLMLPLLTTIDSDTKRQLIKQAEINEDKKTYKVETVVYKEDSQRQSKREKARETYEKKQQRAEDKLESQQEKLERKGEKVDMSLVLQRIKDQNDTIKSNLEKIDVIAIDQAKQNAKVNELNTGLNEVEIVLKDLHGELEKLTESEKSDTITPKEIQKNKYTYQLGFLIASLSLEKSRIEDLAQKVTLLETSNDHLQSSIDVNLNKIDHLKGLGRSDKEKNELLANLRRENQINLRSKQIFIRSHFNKNLDEIIALVKSEDDSDVKKASEEDKAKDLERIEHKHFLKDVNEAITERKALSKVKPTVEESLNDDAIANSEEPVNDETVEKTEEPVNDNVVETKKDNADLELASNNVTEDDDEEEADNTSELVPPALNPEEDGSNFKEVL
ncbi:hypothetical protein ACO0SA_002310 [Hanseniaspora valbyensis]